MSEALLDCAALGALMGLTPKTVQVNASRHPDYLPPRVPGRLLRWHPEAYRAWALAGRPPPPPKQPPRPRHRKPRNPA